MIEAENIRDWRDHNVVDAEGHKIGTLESVYVDTVSDSPFMIGIVTGLPTRRRITFAPLERAVVSPRT